MRNKAEVTAEYERWKNVLRGNRAYDGLYRELSAIEGKEAEIYECFYKDLEFGTAGIRDTVGVGTTRLNEFTAFKIARGLAEYIIDKYPASLGVPQDNTCGSVSCMDNKNIYTKSLQDVSSFDNNTDVNSLQAGSLPKSKALKVVLGRDSRNKSDVFEGIIRDVMLSFGIEVYRFDEIVPIPMISYMVCNHSFVAGIMVTASHNRKEYNGIKIFNEKGVQLNGEQAANIAGYIEKVDPLDFIDFKKHAAINDIKSISIDKREIDGYFNYLKGDIKKWETIAKENAIKSGFDISKALGNIKILYSPLNGTGLKYVLRAFDSLQFKNFEVVTSQEKPSGDFTTCPYPNPEMEEAFNEAYKVANDGFDAIILTDPDCDRMGIRVLHEGRFIEITGNEMGILFLDFLSRFSGKGDGVAIKSIVTTRLIDEIAKARDIEVRNTLTGFKYMGEEISNLEKEPDKRYVFAFEESIGYLPVASLKDKDGISSSALAVFLLAYYKWQGMDLAKRLKEIYEEFGALYTLGDSFYTTGSKGLSDRDMIMQHFRDNGIDKLLGNSVIRTIDYRDKKITCGKGITSDVDILKNGINTGFTRLPKSDVLEYEGANGDILIIRPSGSEAKIKFYAMAKRDDIHEAKEACRAILKEAIATSKALIGYK